MDDFMENIADEIWPQGQRIGKSYSVFFYTFHSCFLILKFRLAFCYQFRDGEKSCKAKDGNPFGPFWDRFNIDFDHNAKFGPLGFDMDYGFHKSAWVNNFPGDKFPVLAFTGT